MDYKIALGVIAVTIGFIAYIPYFRDIFNGKTKPHVFSWFVWSVSAGIAFSAQIVKGAGPGAWVTGFTAIVCASIAIAAFFRGEKNITKIDWISFISALFGVVFWQLTSNPFTAVILVTIADILAFIPTIRKAYKKPLEETASTYSLNALKYAVSLMALQSLNSTTFLYPAYLVLANGLFVIMLFVRRKTTATA
ncbi:MAG: hypothetical protein AAB362_00890, partial [Patescibacteria group bacterium]